MKKEEEQEVGVSEDSFDCCVSEPHISLKEERERETPQTPQEKRGCGGGGKGGKRRENISYILREN